MNFKNFLLESEKEDITKITSNLPKKVKDIIKGYKFNFECGMTLKGDDGHIGVLDPNKKKITVCSPLRYSREFTTLHEIGHVIFDKIIKSDKNLANEWENIVKKIKHKLDKSIASQNSEEIFCHAFAQNYCKHKLLSLHQKPFENFIKKLSI